MVRPYKHVQSRYQRQRPGPEPVSVKVHLKFDHCDLPLNQFTQLSLAI
jgi:hypothetical protein